MNSLGHSTLVPSGVPQGSVFGPVLFAAFMGSVNFSHDNLKCIKYADDVNIVEVLSCNQISSIHLDDCDDVFDLCGLSLNNTKCKQLVFHRSKFSPTRPFNGFSVVDRLKILGDTINNCFKGTIAFLVF